VKRLLATALLTLFGASFVSFGFMHLSPIEPARFMAGFGPRFREEQIQRIREYYRLDRPIIYQYGLWISRAVRGDFGASILTRREVTPEVVRRVPWSLTLAIVSWALAWGLALPLGITAARGGRAAPLAHAITTGGLVVPTFLIATLLVYFFAVRLTWIPILPPFELNFLDPALWLGLLLPGLSLGLPMAAVFARALAVDLRDVLGAAYLTTARAQGHSERRLIWRHALRVTVRTFQARPLWLISVLFSALIMVEEIYNWPGIGRVFMRAVTQRDLPVVQAVLLVLACLVVVVEVLVRVVAGRFGTDPSAAHAASERIAETGRPRPFPAPTGRTRAALVVAAVLVVAAIAAPLLVRFPPDQVLLDEIHNPPTLRHWMGTDSSGRDLFSRLLFAGRVSMGLAIAGALVAVSAAWLLALVDVRYAPGGASAPAPRWWMVSGPRFAEWLGRVMISIPMLPLAITLISVAGRAPVTIALVFAASGLAVAAARVHALRTSMQRWTFLDGARAVGATPRQVGERHLLPHLAPTVLAVAAGLVPGFLLLEATLGFLGYSVTPTLPSWGTLLWRAREALHRGDWWLLTFPIGFLAAASWAFLGISEAFGAITSPTFVRAPRLALGREWGRAARMLPDAASQPVARAGAARGRPVPVGRAPIPQPNPASPPIGGGGNGAGASD
jgi:ABC-type dipeptide/oligopeptide/nickel transport system permease component